MKFVAPSFAAILASLSLQLAPPVLAQSSEPSAAISCLMRNPAGAAANGRPIVIAIPTEKEEEYRARGFKPIGCGAVKLTQAREREKVCDIAASTDRLLALAVERTYGIPAAELCRDVRAAAMP